MGFDKNEMIEQLKFEIVMMEKGRYYPSVREPRQNPEIFRDSITCLNVGLEEKEHPCTSCFLSELLKAEDDPQKLQATVLSWLKRTVAKLEEEVAVSK
jgi:hypothetical protein